MKKIGLIIFMVAFLFVPVFAFGGCDGSEITNLQDQIEQLEADKDALQQELDSKQAAIARGETLAKFKSLTKDVSLGHVNATVGKGGTYANEIINSIHGTSIKLYTWTFGVDKYTCWFFEDKLRYIEVDLLVGDSSIDTTGGDFKYIIELT